MELSGTEFRRLPAMPEFFIYFVEGRESAMKLFPSNGFDEIERHLEDVINTSYDRGEIKKAIEKTMAGMIYEDAQENLDAIKHKDTLFVVVNGKPSVFGGPLYQLIKIADAVFEAEVLNEEFEDYFFIPLFVLDDDLHDNFDCSRTKVFDENLNIIETAFSSISKDDRTIISSLEYDNFEKGCGLLRKYLGHGSKYALLKRIMDSFGKEDLTYNRHFIKFIQQLFPGSGILFFSMMQSVKDKMGAEILRTETEGEGRLYQSVLSSSGELARSGHLVDPKMFLHNLYIIEDNKNIPQHTDDSIIDTREHDPSSLAPRVLLRNVYRDSILPVAEYIASPSEVGHYALLKKYYTENDIKFPKILPRHSASILHDPEFQKLGGLHKDNLLFEYVFPDGQYQERIISPAYFIAHAGAGQLVERLSDLAMHKPDKHYSIVTY